MSEAFAKVMRYKVWSVDFNTNNELEVYTIPVMWGSGVFIIQLADNHSRLNAIICHRCNPNLKTCMTKALTDTRLAKL
jgi:hypothetical protein